MKSLLRKFLKDSLGFQVNYHTPDQIKNKKPSLLAKAVRLGIRLFDPLLIAEMDGERVVFHRLRKIGLLDGFQGKRILEIGPKHGKDTLLLAGLKPKELVLLDLPAASPKSQEWLPLVSSKCNTRYVQGNLLYLTPEDYSQLGKFDLIWCLGVLYHNAEQMRLLKRLFNLCHTDALVVVESEIAHNRKLRSLSAVEIHWPDTFLNVPTITHLPSAHAMKDWMQMCGFTEVKIRNVLSRYLGKGRAVVTGVKSKDSRSYLSYNDPGYVVGDST